MPGNLAVKVNLEADTKNAATEQVFATDQVCEPEQFSALEKVSTPKHPVAPLNPN